MCAFGSMHGGCVFVGSMCVRVHVCECTVGPGSLLVQWLTVKEKAAKSWWGEG